MLSYRHGFHAGNAGDLLKHITLVLVLEHLKKKEKGFCVYDTHAGAGLYDLESDWSQKNQEHRGGIEVVWSKALDLLPLSFYQILMSLNPDGQLKNYPGSPEIIRRMLRPQDRLVAAELHTSEVEVLKSHLGRDPKVAVHHRDGFEAAWALVPPALRRGVVIMDPSYELKEDYTKVSTSLAKALKRWETGIYLVWYPLLGRLSDRSDALKQSLRDLSGKELYTAELLWAEQGADRGMHGSGMAVINPPWGFSEQLRSFMERITPLLGPQGRFSTSEG